MFYGLCSSLIGRSRKHQHTYARAKRKKKRDPYMLVHMYRRARETKKREKIWLKCGSRSPVSFAGSPFNPYHSCLFLHHRNFREEKQGGCCIGML